MERLTGMTEFVLEQVKLLKAGSINILQFRNRMGDYAQFISQKLELWMFVPCKLVDGVWVVIEKPKRVFATSSTLANNIEYTNYYYETELTEFQETKDRVLFEGFTQISGTSIIDYLKLFPNNTIEDLVKYKPTLTASAKKTLGI